MHDCENVGTVLFITPTTFYVMVVWVGIDFVAAGEGLKIAPTIFLPLAAASFGFLPRDFSLGLLAALRVAIGPSHYCQHYYYENTSKFCSFSL